MRVTNMATYRTFTGSINDLHAKYNANMNRMATGEKYEKANENPLAYYLGKQMDADYQILDDQMSLLTNLKGKFEIQDSSLQELHDLLTKAKESIIGANTDTTGDKVQVKYEELLQIRQEMVDTLNATYQGYSVFGGNDSINPPFSIAKGGEDMVPAGDVQKADAGDIIFTHNYRDENGKVITEHYNLTKIMEGKENDPDVQAGITRILKEQSRVDIGYGRLDKSDTLLDTYVGGLNLMGGITSDQAKSMSDDELFAQFKEGLKTSPIMVVSDAVDAIKTGLDTGDMGTMHDKLGEIQQRSETAVKTLGSFNSFVGTKQKTIETVEKRLMKNQTALEEQYKNILGADPYQTIKDLYNSQYLYNVAMQVGIGTVEKSLFDFLGA